MLKEPDRVFRAEHADGTGEADAPRACGGGGEDDGGCVVEEIGAVSRDMRAMGVGR